MNKILWIDDIRNPAFDCDIARTYETAIQFLTNNEYDTVYLDHDLADFEGEQERTGYHITLWLAERRYAGLYTPPNYLFLTSNPVGRANMQSVIERYLVN